MSKKLAGGRVSYTRKPNRGGAYLQEELRSPIMINWAELVAASKANATRPLGPDYVLTDDPDLGAAYIAVGVGTIVRTTDESIGPVTVLLDFDAQDQVVGVEVLYPGTLSGEMEHKEFWDRVWDSFSEPLIAVGDYVAQKAFLPKNEAICYGKVIGLRTAGLDLPTEAQVAFLGAEKDPQWVDVRYLEKTSKWWRDEDET